MTTKKRPAYRAYTVEDIDEENSFLDPRRNRVPA